MTEQVRGLWPTVCAAHRTVLHWSQPTISRSPLLLFSLSLSLRLLLLLLIRLFSFPLTFQLLFLFISHSLPASFVSRLRIVSFSLIFFSFSPVQGISLIAGRYLFIYIYIPWCWLGWRAFPPPPPVEITTGPVMRTAHTFICTFIKIYSMYVCMDVVYYIITPTTRVGWLLCSSTILPLCWPRPRHPMVAAWCLVEVLAEVRGW